MYNMARSLHQPDYKLLFAIVGLLLFGIIMLASASSVVGANRFDDSYFFVKRQLLFGVLPGLMLFYVFAKIDYHMLKRLAMPIYILSIIALMLVFIPGLGSSLGTGARSWIVFGNYSLQPAEFVKLGLVIFLAAQCTRLGHKLTDLKEGLIPTFLFLAFPLALIALQPDTGTLFVISAVVYAMLFFAEATYRHLGLLAVVGVIAFLVMIWAAPYRAERFMTFLHPELDPQGQGYHINQAFLAIGSGGLLGLGLGHSRQKFQYLPEVHADSIYAVMAEELGFFVAAGFVVLLLYICLRGLRIAKSAPDTFGRILMIGIIMWFMAQAFLNIGAMVGLLPLTGVPLPFVSHGGTALMVTLAGVGIMVNISKQTV